MPGNCFSSSKETITKSLNTRGDESKEVNSNNTPPVVASSGPNAGIFAAAQNFTITNSQFIENYAVCNYCAGTKISMIMNPIANQHSFSFYSSDSTFASCEAL